MRTPPPCWVVFRAVTVALALTVLAPAAVASGSTFDLLFPAGYGLSQVTVGAAQDVVLGPGVKIEGIDGSLGIVTSAGDGPLQVGPQATAGAFISTGAIKLGPNVTANLAKSSMTVTLGPGDRIGAVTQGAALTPSCPGPSPPRLQAARRATCPSRPGRRRRCLPADTGR